jgi:hypothetical protein
MPAQDLETLRTFRTALHGWFRRRGDALFELVDALLAAETVTSLPQLSLQAADRRGWGSLDVALAEGATDGAAFRATFPHYHLADRRPICAIDLSVWPRCDAEASSERGFSSHTWRHSAGQPIVAGWGSQWLAQLSFTRDSGTAALDVRRVHPSESPHAIAVAPMKSLVYHLPADGVPPLFVLAAGHDSAQRTKGLREVALAVLICLLADRGHADPSSAEPSPKGAPAQARGEDRLQGSGDLTVADR